MAKRTKRTRRADPCAPQRERLNGLDAQIADLMDQVDDPGIPTSTKPKLLAKLKQLQTQRRTALTALDRCEMAHARRRTPTP